MVMVISWKRLIEREVLLHNASSKHVSRLDNLGRGVGLTMVRIPHNYVWKFPGDRCNPAQISMLVRRWIFEHAMQQSERTVVHGAYRLNGRTHLGQVASPNRKNHRLAFSSLMLDERDVRQVG